MANEKFCLKWNDFESSISGAFKELRDDNDFFDVTLACEDNQVKAHKVILSACSPFFRTILRKNPHQHPLLYLKGLKYNDILSVLNFMYNGEVNVAQEELDSFLSVAEDLKIKGLTQTAQSPGQNKTTTKSASRKYEQESFMNNKSEKSNNISVQRAPKPPRFSSGYDQAPTNLNPTAPRRREMEELPVIKTEAPQVYENIEEATQIVAADAPLYTEPEVYDQYEQTYQDHGMEYAQTGQFKDISQDPYGHIKDYVEKVQQGTGFSCTICGKLGRDMYLMREHLEAQHDMSPGYTCNVCNQYSKNFSTLKAHMKKYH